MEAKVQGFTPRQLDQFFTKASVVALCINHLNSILSKSLSSFDMIMEPSAGNGAFVEELFKYN